MNMAFKFGEAVEIKPAADKAIPWPERQPANKALKFLPANVWTRTSYSPYVGALLASKDIEIRAHIKSAGAPAASSAAPKKGD
jgi:hypothetical protein